MVQGWMIGAVGKAQLFPGLDGEFVTGCFVPFISVR